MLSLRNAFTDTSDKVRSPCFTFWRHWTFFHCGISHNLDESVRRRSGWSTVYSANICWLNRWINEWIESQRKRKFNCPFKNINTTYQLYSNFISFTCTYWCVYMFSSLQVYHMVRFAWPTLQPRYRTVSSQGSPVPSFLSTIIFLPPLFLSNHWLPLICSPSVFFVISSIPHARNIKCKLLRLALFFAQHNSFAIHPSCYVYQ